MRRRVDSHVQVESEAWADQPVHSVLRDRIGAIREEVNDKRVDVGYPRCGGNRSEGPAAVHAPDSRERRLRAALLARDSASRESFGVDAKSAYPNVGRS